MRLLEGAFMPQRLDPKFDFPLAAQQLIAAAIVSTWSSRRNRNCPPRWGTGSQSFLTISVRSVLEAAGVEFIDENGGGPWARLRKPTKEKPPRR